jgi:hypothetical protein
LNATNFEVHHKTHVGFVDAHAERHGRDHDLQIVTLKGFLMLYDPADMAWLRKCLEEKAPGPLQDIERHKLNASTVNARQRFLRFDQAVIATRRIEADIAVVARLLAAP